MSRRVKLGELAKRADAVLDLTDGGEEVSGPPADIPQVPGQASVSPEAFVSLPTGDDVALLPTPADAQPEPSPPANREGSPTTSAQPAQPPSSRPRTPTPDAPRHMHYSEYIAKEARLRDDQYGALTAESRRLNRLRKGRGQRITENTLIRVAIDQLLAKQGQLVGVDEAELRQSLSSDSRPPRVGESESWA